MQQEASSARGLSRAPVRIAFEDVASAITVLVGVARRTSIFTSPLMNEKANAQLFFKCENLQYSGSFKFRGAYTAIASLGEVQQRLGVIANSSGNHAQAVALAAQMLHVPAMIVLPSSTSPTQIAAVRECGAEVLLHEAHEDQRVIIAELADKYGWTLIPSVGHPHVLAGNATAAKELIEEVGPLDYLFVPVKEGGLLCGSTVVAAQLSPDCSVVGVACVETEAAKADCTRETVAVSEHQARAQARLFAEQADLLVEPLGCLGAAAIFERIVDVAGAKVGVILSGGNIDARFAAATRTH